jgi:hypothetical protein
MAPAQIERVDRLDPDRFFSEYNAPARPVIITNALDWPALGKWSHEWFRDTHGDLEVALSTNPTHTSKPVRMRLGKYMQRIIDNERMEGGLYLDQFPLDGIPLLARDFSVPPYCSRERVVLPHLWIGPGTTVLSFHKDNHNPLTETENIFVQVRGRKRITLASPLNDPFMYPRAPSMGAYWHSEVDPESPDLQKYPLYAKAALLEGIVGPGDIIYIPRNYWHHVRALERSISMSFWWSPVRLMEVVGLINYQDDRKLEELRVRGKTVLTVDDIAEFGGVSRIASAFAAFHDAAILEKLVSRLIEHAAEPARQQIATAFGEARRNQAS